jgi:aromatic-amino-acid transaminase
LACTSTTTARSPCSAPSSTAEKARLEAAPPRGYQPIEGPVAYNNAVQNLLFGADSAIIRDGRVVTAQALGGTGALASAAT